MRYKYSDNKKLIINTTRKYNNNHLGLKPNGFWYAYGPKWEQFITNDYTNFKQKKPYKYNINISKKYFTTNLNAIKQNKILILKSMNDITNFISKYIVKQKEFDRINLNKLINDFSGIEIRYIPRKIIKTNYKLYTWLLTFDTPSGCIWNFNDITIELT